MTCSYAFTGQDGKPVLITGKESFKAYLVSGGLANFGINLQSDKGEAKLSVANQEAKPENAKSSRGRTRETIHPEDFAATMRAAKRAYPGVQIIGHDSDQANSVPRDLKASIKRQGATNDVKGAFHNGEIHIFGSAIPDIHTLEFTIAHEGTHFGLSSKFGPGIDEVMLDINRNNPTVAARAEELQAQYGYSVARSTEEVLADLGGDMVKVKGFARLVAYIRDFLRKHGFVTEWSDNDVAALVMAARDYAKNKNATTVYRGSVFKEGQIPRTIEVDGKQRPTMNSEGRQIHPTEEGVRNFYKWFGDSKVVDEQGRPLVVYHGSKADIKAFDPSKIGTATDSGWMGRGFYFGSQETASAYSGVNEFSGTVSNGANVMPVYVAMQNPAILQDSERNDGQRTLVRELLDLSDNATSEEVSRGLKDASYDGSIYKRWSPSGNGYKEYAVFRPEQIKSAIGNNGDFSPESPNITYSRTSLISPAQRALTRTDAFKEWFGSSKMAAQDGTPLLFMHGTPAKFDAFDSKHVGANSSHTSAGLGHFFTREAGTAQKYADGGTILKGWIKMERPYVMPMKEAQAFESAKDSAARRMELQQKGYDGAVILDDQGKPWATVAFHPWQFKSTENKGAFDEFDDRFRFSRKESRRDLMRDRAGWTPERTESLVRAFSYPAETTKTKAYAAWVSPSAFLDATTPTTERGRLEGEAGPLDRAKLSEETQPIYLEVEEDGEEGLYRIVGHEGRHRMMALRDAGVDRVPVVIRTRSAVEAADVVSEPYFSAQRFGDGTKGRRGFDVQTMTPISMKFADDIREEFSAQESEDRVRFSRTNQGQAGAWPIEPIGKGDRFIYNMQNKQIDTKRVVEAAKKSGVNVTDDINPYLQEELYHGRSAKKFDDFRNKELRPLLDSIRAAGLSLADVESYLWASHAKERNAQIAKINDKMPDGGSGLTNKQADDLLAGRNVTVNGNEIKGVSQSALPVMQGIAKQVQAINAATRQMLVDSGMETADTIKAWEGAYSNYVPLHREDIEQGGMGTGMGFSVRGSASKRAVGSGRTVVDILGNIANQRERQIARVEKNRVGQAVLGLAKSAPNEDFWKVDDVPMMKTVEATPVFTAYDKAGKVLGTYDTQLQADRAHPSAGVTIRRTVEDKVRERIDPTFRSKDEVFHVRVDGKDHFVTFNPQDERSMRMAMALKNLDADQLGAVLQVTSKATRFFASMATQYNPIWGVVNLTRDVQGALLNLSTTDLKGKEKEVLGHTLSALKGIYADLRAHRAGKKPSSKWASLFEEMQDEGGQTGYKDMFGNAKDRTEALERELDPTKWMRSPLGRIFTADGRLKVPMEIAQKRAEGFFGWLSDFNQTTENAIRLASYKTAVDSGMSKQQAASIAKNVSINFNRKGQVATQAGALYAFFNASMQGSARLAETLRGPLGKKIIKGGLALGVMQAMMLSAAGMGDDEPPEFVRERSFIIPIGDGKYFSIPLPLGFHVLPNLSRIPTEYAMSGFKNGGKRIADLFGLVADTFNPIGNAGLSLQTIAPTVIDPLAALAENKDYTGKRIAKEDMSSLHPTPGYLRAKDTASEISKFMAQLFNAASGGTEFKQGMFSPTPDQLDYLIGQIAGGVGREALKIDQTISSTVTGEELPMHKIPLLGRFVGDTKGQSAESGKFYAALTRINEHQAELKGLRASGRSVEAAEYAKENPEARLVLMATATERALSEDHKLKRKAIAAGNSDLVKQIEARSSARMKAFNERLAALEN